MNDMIRTLLNMAHEVGITGFLDMALMSMLVYALIIWFKRSKAFFVLIGIFIVGFIYLVSREFDLKLTTSVLQGFLAAILFVLVVIFQEELKHMFERVAVASLHPRTPRKQLLQLAPKEVEIVVLSVANLPKEKIGALIVLGGRDIIDRHLTAGVDLNGELSEQLL